MEDRTAELVKLHEGTYLEMYIYEHNSFDSVHIREILDTYMKKEDFEKAAQKFFAVFQPHSCDLFMNELKRLIDADREARRIELERLNAERP